MIRNICEALSRIALVSLASLVGCVDVDDAPELGETADSVTSGTVETSANATSEVSADLATATAPECNPFGWGQVCSRTNDEDQFVGTFNNNSGGSNTIKMIIWRYNGGNPYPVLESSWVFVPYSDSFKMKFYPVYGALYNTCIYLADGRAGCSGWSRAG